MALALLTTALPSSVVTATDWPSHCPNHQVREADKFTKPLSWQPRAGLRLCFKGGVNGATGIFVSDGRTLRAQLTDMDYLNPSNEPPAASYILKYGMKQRKVLRYGGRILGPCGDPFYTARVWNSRNSTRAVTVILEVRNGRRLWKRTLQPGQSAKPRATWLPGGKVLILRRGNGTVIDRERTVSGTYSWSECRNG